MMGVFATPNTLTYTHMEKRVIRDIEKGKFIDLNKLSVKDAAITHDQFLTLKNGQIEVKEASTKAITSFTQRRMYG